MKPSPIETIKTKYCLLTNEDMGTVDYREKAASAYLAKKRKQSNDSGLCLFLFLSVVLLAVLCILAYTIAHAY